MNKRCVLVLLMMTVCSMAIGAPSNSISVPNTAVSGTVISSSDYNDNNNEVQTKYNAHTHTDLTALGTVSTGVWVATAINGAYLTGFTSIPASAGLIPVANIPEIAIGSRTNISANCDSNGHQVTTNTFITVTCLYNAGSTTVTAYSDSSATPTTKVGANKGTTASVSFLVKKNDYYKVVVSDAVDGTVAYAQTIGF